MSRRTLEASKAIRDAWETEQQLVLAGKGTRDWTQEQQQSIIDKGKAYDEDGKAFEGHHMKSAEAYPEYQGDADNIQFLSRNEHLDAHGGSWSNPTNGYYDPVTKLMRDFGDNKYEPCKIIKLSNPVVTGADSSRDAGTARDDSETSSVTTNEHENKEAADVALRNDKAKADGSNVISAEESLPSMKRRKLQAKHSSVIDRVKEFEIKHPVYTSVAKLLILAFGAEVANGIISALSNSGSSGQSGSSVSDLRYSPYGTDDESSSSSPGSEDECADERDYPEERTSPREHSVSGYDRQQNGKTVHVNPYKRGGKTDAD